MAASTDTTYAPGGSGASAPVRVIAIDDHPLTRRGVAEELGEDARLEVLGTFPSFGAVPLPLRTPTQVKVAVIDLAVRHETRGVESVALVSSWGIPSVVYTMHGSAIIRDEALRAGALGFVSKSAAGGELVTAVLEAAAGRTYEAGVEYLPGGEELTDLERRVLHEIPSGATSKEIAMRVGLAGGTVDNVISSIIAKLNLKGKKRSALASWAVEHGLGPSES